jgi:hypothetical protein
MLLGLLELIMVKEVRYGLTPDSVAVGVGISGV